jgi:hypothetical protein
LGVSLAAIAYGTIAILLGYAISLERLRPYRWIFVGWIAFIVPNFVFRAPMPAMLLAAIILILLPKKTGIERVILYIGMFTAIPSGVLFHVPFPGINYLIVLDSAKLACVILLVPIVLAGTPRGEQGVDPTISFLLLLLVLLVTALSIRDLPFTSALRAGVDGALLLLPALAISMAIRSEQDLECAMKALLALGAIYAGIAIVSQIVRWNFYTPGSFADIRSGVMRVSVTTVHVMVGLVGVVAFIIGTFGTDKGYPRLRLIAFQTAISLTIFFTVARGAWVAGFAAIATYMIISSRVSNFSAVVIAGVGAVAGLVAGTTTLLSFDAYNTFSYRAELLKAAAEQFWDAPFFGSPNYLESGRFDHLWTGAGLIDVVNYYVQVTMEYGAVGLILYVAPFVVVMMALLRYRVPKHRRSDDKHIKLNRMVGVMWACLAAYIVLIMTISGVSYIVHFGYILLGLSMGAIKVAAVAAGERRKAPVEILSVTR